MDSGLTAPLCFALPRNDGDAIAPLVPCANCRSTLRPFPATDCFAFCENSQYGGICQDRNDNVIDLYTWTTPNGRKASIMLEEIGLPYTAHAVDIGKDEQFKPEFLKISPNNRIPAIVDRDTGISLMESAALMFYLADQTGKLLPKSGEPRYRVLEWLMWQMGGPGPMFGPVPHFVTYNNGKA